MEGDGGHGLVLSLNGYTFFGFNRLVQAVAPAATRHETACEFVNDDDFTFLHHIVLIAVIDVLGAQCSREVVHERNVGGVVKACTFRNEACTGQNAFCFFVSLFGQEHLVRFFIDREIARLGDALAGARIGFAFLATQQRNHLVHGLVLSRLIICLTADDERCARLVNQNGVDLVNDGVVQAALNTVFGLIHHVVAQIVKTKFVVGTVCDV